MRGHALIGQCWLNVQILSLSLISATVTKRRGAEWWPAGKKDAAAGAAVAKRSMKQPKLPFGPKRPKAETEQHAVAERSAFCAA